MMSLYQCCGPGGCVHCSIIGTLLTFLLSPMLQVAVLQSDARAELEAAQTRMQLLRLKQQRMANCLKGSITDTTAA